MHPLLVEKHLDWRWWVTPKPLAKQPIHRWYIFPHSFSSELVHELIEEWNLRPKDRILDPFAGAGTTILAGKEKGIPATGYDLSPLAVLAARAKIANYNLKRLERGWETLKKALRPSRWNGASRSYPELVEDALPGKLLGAFDAIQGEIGQLPCSGKEKDFYRLALLTVLPKYSRAIATGGWLKWVDKGTKAASIPLTLTKRVEEMFSDLRESTSKENGLWQVRQVDARWLPEKGPTYTAVITSPPYPNRHDYTRVFGVELMFGFLDWEETRELRYQSFHSHPEARPDRPKRNGYQIPKRLERAISQMRKENRDERIKRMLEGYFLDMFLCLQEVRRVCKAGARAAFVVGNAQYGGTVIPVDELTAEIGEQAGLNCERLVVARYRGNSAQQMGRYGRRPSRESVVIFRKKS